MRSTVAPGMRWEHREVNNCILTVIDDTDETDIGDTDDPGDDSDTDDSTLARDLSDGHATELPRRAIITEVMLLPTTARPVAVNTSRSTTTRSTIFPLLLADGCGQRCQRSIEFNGSGADLEYSPGEFAVVRRELVDCYPGSPDSRFSAYTRPRPRRGARFTTGAEIDRVDLTGWSFPTGASLQMRPTVIAADP